VKRFLCGVEGVKDIGNDELLELLGGVWERVGSWVVVECDAGRSELSGDKFGGVGCGIVVSKISARKSVENVRFASSAKRYVSPVTNSGIYTRIYFSGSESRREVSASSPSTVLQESHHRATN
jgi:hypothetical protein